MNDAEGIMSKDGSMLAYKGRLYRFVDPGKFDCARCGLYDHNIRCPGFETVDGFDRLYCVYAARDRARAACNGVWVEWRYVAKPRSPVETNSSV